MKNSHQTLPITAKAIALHQAGKLDEAEALYRSVLADNPRNTETLNLLVYIQFQRGDMLEGLKLAEQSLAINPSQPETLNNQGVILQALNRHREALASCDKAIAIKPDYADAWYNRANSLQTLRRLDDALASYDKAIAIRSDYADAYNNRGVTLQDLGRYDEALASYDKAIAINPANAEAYNNRGVTLQRMQRYEEALASCDKAIAIKPGHVDAYNNRGVTLQKMKRYGEALESFDKAMALKSDFAQVYNNRGVTFQEMNRYDDALMNYDKAVALNSDYAEAYYNRGLTLQKMKRYDDALASYDKAVSLKPDHAEAYNNRGVTLVNKGDMKEAEKMFLKALALRPNYPNPLFSLTNIHKYKDADAADIKTMQALLDNSDASMRDREYLYFALGKIYDDCGRWDAAFECYRQGNEILNKNAAYKSEIVTEFTDHSISTFTKDFLARRFSFASDSRQPLFIIGMPRSGTTLMASILSNHPAIASAGELSTITEFTLRLPELMPYPQAVKHLTPATATRLIHDYEQRLRRDFAAGKSYIIDKHPLNFRQLGLITMLFPNARIIHCTRHPLDTGLSNYFQLFAMDYDYSFDLKNIGHFYAEYTRLMEHWHKVLPTPIIDVSYEDMIMNTESLARKTLDALDLPWNERCLTPHTNAYAVETASNWQVRQPIYTQSLGRWRHYEKYLAPLKEMLPPAAL